MNGKLVTAAFLAMIALSVVALIALRRSIPPPLRLDDRMVAVFTGTTRVETFSLADPGEAPPPTRQETEITSKEKFGRLGDHTILRPGPIKDRAFAIRLANALEQTRDFGKAAPPAGFIPGVGFKVWKGQEHVEVALCFHCSGAEVILKDAHDNPVKSKRSELGHARADLLKLCKEALPNDRRLQAIKE